MANEKRIIQALCAELESTFSTLVGSTYGTGSDHYKRIPAEDMKWEPSEDYIERMVQTTALAVKHAGIVGGKGGKLSFKVGVVGCTTPGASTIAAVPNAAISELLRACGWSQTLDTGTVVTGAGSTTTVVEVASAAAITVGSQVMINGEARGVTAVNTAATPDNITVSPALSAIPSDAVVVYAGANYTVGDANPGTIGFVAKSDGYVYRLTGCKGICKIDDTNARDRVMLSFEFQVDAWDNTEPSGTFPALTPVNNVVAIAGSVFWGTTATPTALVGFDPGWTLNARPSVSGTQGRAGWAMADGKPTLKLKPYFSTAYRTDFEARTEREVVAQFGAVAGMAVAIHASKAQIAAYPAEDDAGGVVAHGLTLAINDTQLTTVTTPYQVTFF